MRELKITGCKDSSMWYAGLVGQRVPLLREESDVYLSREPAGYTNIVRKTDAKVVWVDLEGVEFGDGEAVSCACKATVMTLSHSVSRCHPIGPVPLGSSHTVARCTFDPSAIGTMVHLPLPEEVPEPQAFGGLMQSIAGALAYGRALLDKGTKGQ